MSLLVNREVAQVLELDIALIACKAMLVPGRGAGRKVNVGFLWRDRR